MKHIIIPLLFLLASVTSFAQSEYLGRIATDGFLAQIFDDYKMTRGSYIYDDQIYMNAEFRGFKGPTEITLETNGAGEINSINLDYHYAFKSRDDIKKYADQVLSLNRARIVEQEFIDRRLYI